jgi:tetratricopeptide (TPR) repeat protein
VSAYVVCPACGTRIKAGREFCLKCFEPLPHPDAVVPTPLSVSLGLSAGQQAILSIVGGLAVVGLLAVIWQTRPVPIDDEVRPDVRGAERPAPTAVAAPSTPSVQDFAAVHVEGFEPTPLPPAPQVKLEPAEVVALEARLAEYDQELLKRADDSYLLNRKGQVLERLGRVGEAMTCFERAVASAPETPSYHFNLARAASALGRAESAIAEYREVARLQPSDAAAHYTLALALQKQGDDQDAIAEFDRAVALVPGNSNVHLSLGTSLERVGRPADAVHEYQRYLAIQPTSADAQRLKDHVAVLSAALK